jgi:hypothetical protein
MYEEGSNPAIAHAMRTRMDSFVKGVAFGWGLAHLGDDLDQCPPLSAKSMGPSPNQFESGFKVGYLEAFTRRHK